MNFGRLFRQHAAAEPVQTVDEDRLQQLLESCKGMQGSEVVEQFVAEVRSGKYQIPICADDPEKAARTMAAQLRAKNIIGLGCGVPPAPFQVAMIYDPPDGPGAGVEAFVTEGLYSGASRDAAEALLLGHVTCLGYSMYHRLRGLVLVPFKAERARNGDMACSLSLHFGWTVGEEVRVVRSTTVVTYSNNKLVVLPELKEQEEPDDDATRLIRAAFEVNRLVAPMHAKHRLGSR